MQLVGQRNASTMQTLSSTFSNQTNEYPMNPILQLIMNCSTETGLTSNSAAPSPKHLEIWSPKAIPRSNLELGDTHNTTYMSPCLRKSPVLSCYLWYCMFVCRACCLCVCVCLSICFLYIKLKRLLPWANLASLKVSAKKKDKLGSEFTVSISTLSIFVLRSLMKSYEIASFLIKRTYIGPFLDPWFLFWAESMPKIGRGDKLWLNLAKTGLWCMSSRCTKIHLQQFCQTLFLILHTFLTSPTTTLTGQSPTLLDTANTSQRSKPSKSVTTTRNLNSQVLTMRSLNPSWWALASDLEASQESESEIWPEEIKATARPCHNHLENRSFFPSDPNISNDPQMQLCWQATLRFSFACVAWLCNDFEVWLTPDATASGPATSFASSLSLRWNRKSEPQAASRRSNPDYGAADWSGKFSVPPESIVFVCKMQYR